MANGKCRISGKQLVEVLDLGNQYISDFVQKGMEKQVETSSLKLGICENSKLLQLFDTYSQEKIYRKYWYKSGVNEKMIEELKSIVLSSQRFIKLSDSDCVVDIASNDGTLLNFYNENIQCIGFDPSDVAKKSKNYNKNKILINDFFNSVSFNRISKKKAKIISCISMFYDLEDPKTFLYEVKEILDENGIFVIQLGYMPLMMELNEFGHISHEHLCYYTFKNLIDLLDSQNFEVFDVDINDCNGGSIRMYITHKGEKTKLKCPSNLINIGNLKLQSLLLQEIKGNYSQLETYIKFKNRIEKLKNETVNWLNDQKKQGKKVIGYGASTKGNVLLQYYSIDQDLLPYIAERSPEKFGLCTSGTGIPIISEDEMRNMKPDYLFALPWFFISNFIEREKKLMQDNGTKFVIPQPSLKILGL
jgi:SAM-dependent methyltransferase